MKVRDTSGREVKQEEINMGAHKIINVTDPASAQDAATKAYVDDNAGLWEVDGSETQLKTADELDMQTKKIINMADPASAQDADTKAARDAAITTAGLWEVDGSETQLKTADEIDMQTKKIINVVDPTANQDASTKKYVDDNIPTVEIKIGSYVGDGTDARQITTGFKCGWLIIVGQLHTFGAGFLLRTANWSIWWVTSYSGNGSDHPAFHASDGFTVGDLIYECNLATYTYNYIAFGEYA